MFGILGSGNGRLVMVGLLMPCSRHEARAWHRCGLARRMLGRLHRGGLGVIGDLGCPGTGVLTDFAADQTGHCPYRSPVQSQHCLPEAMIALEPDWLNLNLNHASVAHRARDERAI
jgi:hypothetical protein